jgi:hypothetical protein
VTPAAIAVRLTKRAASAVVVSILVAVSATWAGLFIGWYEPYPVSFFIVAIVFVEYVVLRGIDVLRESSLAQAVDAPEREGVRALRNASASAALSELLLVGGAALLVVSLLAHPGAAWNPGPLANRAPMALALIGLGAVVGLASFLLYFSGFRKMAASSREFTTPTFLSLVGIVGFLLTVGGLGLVLTGVGFAASSYALAPLAELFGAPLLLLGLLLSLVGLFGQAVGSWRFGLRYEERTSRTGAVLMVVPMAGHALTFLGYRRALRRGVLPLAASTMA